MLFMLNFQKIANQEESQDAASSISTTMKPIDQSLEVTGELMALAVPVGGPGGTLLTNTPKQAGYVSLINKHRR